MIEKHGDLFDTDAAYIGHGVNTQGMMGAGIAKTFRDQFHRNYAVYKRACIEDTLKPGGFLVVPEKDWDCHLRLIVNFATQEQPGPDATYEWVMASFLAFAKQASEPNRLRLYGNRIAIPEIGCGIGGLEWSVVELIIRAIEAVYPIEFEVWHYVG